MAEQTGNQPPPDVVQLWREWLTQSERQFNAFMGQTMGGDSFARGVGGYMELTAAFQRLMGESMQRYLSFFNMPSRADVVALADALRTIEERLIRIEETLQIAVSVGMAQGRTASSSEPVRTRRPEHHRFPEEHLSELATIPEELRR